MKRAREILREFFDIRAGEHLRLWAMFSYLLFVLFAYYIVKPVSRAMFLTKFDIDKLPGLYILIAVFGGLFAYLYSKVATKVSLRSAVSWAMALSIAVLLGLWWLIRLRVPGMVYALNIWVSLFSVILVSQGWLVAGNLFDARQAKRLYPLLNMGLVLGAAFGGEFTKRAVTLIGTEGLLPASAVMVLLAYISFLIAGRAPAVPAKQAPAAAEEHGEFSVRQIVGDLTRVRHLRVVVGMMVVMYVVDTLVEYQFQAMARTVYRGDNLTAFFGQFYGLWLNGVEFVFQLFLTGAVVRWFGIGATLQISPVAVGVSSLAVLAAPGVLAASAVRLTEASTRYTLSKTGMELLYMPLPLALRNRIKAFIDICVDRLSRGAGGVLLLFLTTGPLHMGVRGIGALVLSLSIVWSLYAVIARREYVATIRGRLRTRTLDFAATRLAVTDAHTISVLEAAALEAHERRAPYALSLLAEAPGYDVRPMLQRLAASLIPEVRGKVYEIATRLRFEGLLTQATREIFRSPVREAIVYAVTLSPANSGLATQLLEDERIDVVDAALEGMRSQHDLAAEVIGGPIGRQWLDRMERSENPRRRALAASAIGVYGKGGGETLHRLLDDREPEVVRAALRAAGALADRAYLYKIVTLLGNPRLRGAAVASLNAFGAAITGTLSDVLNDDTVPLRIRRQIPRVLKNVPDQRSVEVLLPAIAHPDLSIRVAVLKALNRLRQTDSQLNFDQAFVTDQLLNEARNCYELSAALAPFRSFEGSDRPAVKLLARTMQDRLKGTVARLFRLLGLSYPPKEIYAAYLAVSRPTQYNAAAALEFLDTLIDGKVKRVLLPLLDAPEFALDRGREIFGLRELSTEELIRMQIGSGDPWLAACSAAAAAELKIGEPSPSVQALAT
jgi:ATP/ADP translocase